MKNIYITPTYTRTEIASTLLLLFLGVFAGLYLGLIAIDKTEAINQAQYARRCTVNGDWNESSKYCQDDRQ